MAMIGGTKLPKQYRLGYLISNFTRIGNFTPEDESIGFGQLLKYGSATGQYEAMDGTERDSSQLAGISVYPQARTGFSYPGGPDVIRFGEYGDVLQAGDIVVELSADTVDPSDIVEGGKVYLGSDGKVSTLPIEEVDKVVNHLPQLMFLGSTEVDGDKTVVAIRKLY